MYISQTKAYAWLCVRILMLTSKQHIQQKNKFQLIFYNRKWSLSKLVYNFKTATFCNNFKETKKLSLNVSLMSHRNSLNKKQLLHKTMFRSLTIFGLGHNWFWMTIRISTTLFRAYRNIYWFLHGIIMLNAIQWPVLV